MSEQDRTAQDIVDAVADAVTTIAPLTGPAAPFVALAAKGIQAIMSLAEQLGQADAVKVALDAELAAARHLTDEALARKHAERTERADEPTSEQPLPGPRRP